MNPFKGRHFERHIILWAVRWYWRQPSGFGSWHFDETYVKVNGRWAYLYRALDSRGCTIKGIEVMRALRKGQAESFYLGHPLGEMRLVSRVFER
ncbi:DDE-type integrase/transposase/recombinase [Candidatus Erwinia dacicola]